MLKKLFIILFLIIVAAIIIACGADTENPGHDLDLLDILDIIAENQTNEIQTVGEINETKNTDDTIGQTHPESETEIVENIPPPKYETYDNPDLGFKIQYPADWTCINSDISIEEFNGIILDLLGPEAAAGLLNGINPRASSLMWYYFGNIDDSIDFIDSIMPIANLLISDAGNITQDDFQSPMNLMELQNQFDNYYPLILDGFKSDGIFGQSLGENYYAVYNYNYSDGDIISSCYQAVTEKNGFLYTYTFTNRDGELNTDAYEKMLSAMTFY